MSKLRLREAEAHAQGHTEGGGGAGVGAGAGPGAAPPTSACLLLEPEAVPETTNNRTHRSQSLGVTLHGATFDALW